MNAQNIIAQFVGEKDGWRYVIRKDAVYRFAGDQCQWFCSLKRLSELGQETKQPSTLEILKDLETQWQNKPTQPTRKQ